jgi:hypothetical protein
MYNKEIKKILCFVTYGPPGMRSKTKLRKIDGATWVVAYMQWLLNPMFPHLFSMFSVILFRLLHAEFDGESYGRNRFFF